MRKIILLLCFSCSFFYLKAQVCNTPYHVVVIGSSTAAGMGATPNHGWVALYTQYLKGINTSYQVDNLAVGGYTTYDLCPTGFIPSPNRPAPDPNHNITKALSLNPDAIIINLPTNDAGRDYTVTEQQDNYKRMVAAAAAQGVKVWIATSQPRNAYNAGQIANLKAIRDWIISFYGSRSIDFWTGLTEPNDSIKHIYSYGDGIHLNDAGHQLLYTRVVARNIPDTLCGGANPFNLTSFAVNQSQSKLYLTWYTNNEKNTSQFLVEHSTDSLNWGAIGTVAAAGNYTGSRFYSFTDTTTTYMSAQYYRLNMVTTGNNHFYSNTVKGMPDTMYANPFRVSAFTVAQQQNKFLLNWSTTAEKNTNRFTVQRSPDSLTWNNIGYVTAAGNSTTLRSYSFTDTATRTTAAWYRLNMSTHDSRIFYSKVVKSLPGVVPPDTTTIPNPFNLTSFTVGQWRDQLHLNWATNNESNSASFIVERSSDSLSWNNIATIAAAGSYPGLRSYNYPDTTIHSGARYYRLHMVTLNNKHFYSSVVKGMPDTLYAQPFRLSSFTLATVQGKFRLSWSTSAEANTKQFIIERSADSLIWSNTGTVGAAGNATTTRTYTFTDTATLTGSVYYRLHMVTHDNRHFYSTVLKGIAPLQRSSAPAYAGAGYFIMDDSGKGVSLQAVPNPAVDNVKITGLTTGNHVIKVYDLSGRLVYINRQFQAGSNVAVDGWASGLYIIVVDDSKQQLKLMKK